MMDKKIKQALIGEFLASIKPEFREELKDMMEQIVDQMEEWGIDDPRSEEGRKILAAKLKEKEDERLRKHHAQQFYEWCCQSLSR